MVFRYARLNLSILLTFVNSVAFLSAVGWEVKRNFFEGIERIISQHNAYVIVSCTILKEQLNKFCVRGEEDNVYGLSLSYLIERSIFCVDNEIKNGTSEISIVVERRGKNEDNKLLNYYNGLRNRGTKWITPDRLRTRIGDFGFEAVKHNIFQDNEVLLGQKVIPH